MVHGAGACLWVEREGLQGRQHQMRVRMALRLPCWPLLTHSMGGGHTEAIMTRCLPSPFVGTCKQRSLQNEGGQRKKEDNQCH